MSRKCDCFVWLECPRKGLYCSLQIQRWIWYLRDSYWGSAGTGLPCFYGRTRWRYRLRIETKLVSDLNSDDIIFNYSHRGLIEAEKIVLARGLRFCLPPKKVDRYDVKCSFELLFREVFWQLKTRTDSNVSWNRYLMYTSIRMISKNKNIFLAKRNGKLWLICEETIGL